jgi:hypothetical protein
VGFVVDSVVDSVVLRQVFSEFYGPNPIQLFSPFLTYRSGWKMGHLRPDCQTTEPHLILGLINV